MLKKYLSADQLLRDAIELGMRVVQSGFRPDLIAGVWRGGTPVAIAVHEVLAFAGIACDHIAIRTTSYTGIGTRARVEVHGLDYLVRALTSNPARPSSLLIVDDVFDTGLSIAQVLNELQERYAPATPDIRIAVPYFKSDNNRTGRIPDYYLHTPSEWLVFPHELQGLADAEILAAKTGMQDLASRLLELRNELAAAKRTAG